MARILIVRLSSFGDVAMLVPVVYSAAANNPQDRFVVLTRKAFSPLFENLGFNISTKSFDKKRHGSIYGFFKLLMSVSKGRYSHVADMHDVLRTKIIRAVLFLQGKKTAYIDKGKKQKKELIQNKNLIPPLKPTIERYHEVFDKLGFEFEISFTNFFEFRERSVYPLRSLVKEKEGKWIGIAPFSKHKGKVYPLKKMEKVLSIFTSNPENTVFLFSSGDKENMIVKRWQEKYSNAKVVAGSLNMENELLLISFLDVMISMDSANMHLASLVETPVVSVWGATHPSMGFYGYKQDLANAVQMELCCQPCSVYGEIPCVRKDYACMNRIEPEMIVEKANRVISSRSVNSKI